MLELANYFKAVITHGIMQSLHSRSIMRKLVNAINKLTECNIYFRIIIWLNGMITQERIMLKLAN